MRNDIGRKIIEGGRANTTNAYVAEKRHRGRLKEEVYYDCDEYSPLEEDRGREIVVKQYRPSRKGRYGRQFQRDKLSIMYRFFRSRCGRKWDDVYSEFCRASMSRLDRHHINLHMEQIVCVTTTHTWWRWYDFYVDQDGILREYDRRR